MERMLTDNELMNKIRSNLENNPFYKESNLELLSSVKINKHLISEMHLPENIVIRGLLKGENNMLYSKIFKYKNNGGVQRRSVTVCSSWGVDSAILPKEALPLLAKELSSVISNHTYNRVNPYKFDTETDRHVYIQYAEPCIGGYDVHRKMIMRVSHKGNIKIPQDTFIYDLLDYFVEINLLDKDYKFIGEINNNLIIETVRLYDKDYLINQGFKFPINTLRN